MSWFSRIFVRSAQLTFLIGGLLSVAFPVVGQELADRVYSRESDHLEFLASSRLHYFEHWEGEYHNEVETEYIFREIGGLTFIQADGWTASAVLLISEDAVQVYETDEQPVFAGLRGRRRSGNAYLVENQMTLDATSELTETLKSGEVVTYGAENASWRNGLVPWVEGVPGSGVGEAITITISETYANPGNPFHMDYRTIHVVNGFVSVDQPYLYSMNGRVKSFRVIGLDTGTEKLVQMDDTPHPQPITVSYEEFGRRIRLEIADVYAGTRFDDTCISALIVTGSTSPRNEAIELMKQYGVWD